MSAHQTLIGHVDKWRMRREWIRREALNWFDESEPLTLREPKDAVMSWTTLHVAAELWERLQLSDRRQQ